MVVPPSGKLRIVWDALRDGAVARALTQEIGKPSWTASARLLKHDDRTSVFAGEAVVDGERLGVIVKVMRADRWSDRLARWTTGTRLMRQWNGAAELREAGIPTPDCYVLWRDAQGIECLAMEQIEGRTLLYEMARVRHTVRMQHTLAGNAGRLVARISEAGLFNRDMKPSNVMVRWVDGVPNLCVIDTAGISNAKPGAEAVMLAKLLVECLGIEMRPRLPLMMRAIKSCGDVLGWSREKRKHMWRVVDFVVQRHGDPRPVVDPLGDT